MTNDYKHTMVVSLISGVIVGVVALYEQSFWIVFTAAVGVGPTVAIVAAKFPGYETRVRTEI